LLEWIAWDSFEFEKGSRVSKYSFYDPCLFYSRSYYAPFWCDFYNSSDHETNSGPYYACYDQSSFVSPWVNADFVLTLHDSSHPLAQCTELKVGEPFAIIAKPSVVDVCFESEDIFDEVHDLVEAP